MVGTCSRRFKIFTQGFETHFNAHSHLQAQNSNALVFSILAPNVQNNPTIVEIMSYPKRAKTSQKNSNALMFSILAPHVQNNLTFVGMIIYQNRAINYNSNTQFLVSFVKGLLGLHYSFELIMICIIILD